MLATLRQIAEQLNSQQLVWAVGGSIMLSHYGLAQEPNDIDLLVDLKDIAKADEILSSVGEKKNRVTVGQYSTKYFYEYVINGFDVDVMSGLAINHQAGTLYYIFDEQSIAGYKEMGGIKVPLNSLEDWYVLYQLISGRHERVDAIEGYLESNGVTRPDLLIRMLRLNLPDDVRANVYRMWAGSSRTT
jgi:hypothetical protein